MLVYDQYLYEEKPDLDDDVVVFHAGFCSTAPNYSYGKDTRDYYLIHYVTKGKGLYRVGNTLYHLKENDGFLILPGSTIVHTADKNDPWDVCWVAFFGREIPKLLKDAGLDEDHLIFHYDKDDFLEKCIKDIYNESRNQKNTAYIKGAFYQFMGKLIEQQQEQRRQKNREEASSFSHFEDAMIYIRRNIRYQISVEHLANYLRLSPSQVYRIFMANTGKSPQKVIRDMRMEKACEFLAKTDLPIREISEWLDFEYPSHFCKQFKNKMKMSPSEYRKLHEAT
ncbi:MAG: AraC family transcriptional regulator [Eubacteriales bacterium]|nr:AraC family transcriptional regulator [Eubacteriales bacterium]